MSSLFGGTSSFAIAPLSIWSLDRDSSLLVNSWSIVAVVVSIFSLSVTTTVVGDHLPTGDLCIFIKRPPKIVGGVSTLTGGAYNLLKSSSSVIVLTGVFTILYRGPVKSCFASNAFILCSLPLRWADPRKREASTFWSDVFHRPSVDLYLFVEEFHVLLEASPFRTNRGLFLWVLCQSLSETSPRSSSPYLI